MSMHPKVADAFEEIDAAIFSGDTFWDKDNMDKLEKFLGRWYRGMVSTKQSVAECESEEAQDE